LPSQIAIPKTTVLNSAIPVLIPARFTAVSRYSVYRYWKPYLADYCWQTSDHRSVMRSTVAYQGTCFTCRKWTLHLVTGRSPAAGNLFGTVFCLLSKINSTDSRHCSRQTSVCMTAEVLVCFNWSLIDVLAYCTDGFSSCILQQPTIHVESQIITYTKFQTIYKQITLLKQVNKKQLHYKVNQQTFLSQTTCKSQQSI